MKSQKEVREYAAAAAAWIYVWGANGEELTQPLCDRLYRDYGSATYDKNYYMERLTLGKGKMAADCSGFLMPLSGYDDTAQGYYNACSSKGLIGDIPSNLVCLVFKRNESGRMHHIGINLGDGFVAEMASSKLNYQHNPLSGAGWTHWGIPDWIDSSENLAPAGCTLDLTVKLPSLILNYKCSYVKTLQVLLITAGYHLSDTNGIFDIATETAVKAFQQKEALMINYPGTVGKKTWEALLKG